MTARQKRTFVSEESRRRMDDQQLRKHTYIGVYRSIYKQPKRCPHTRWAEQLYHPKYNDPAFMYVKTREAERSRREDRTARNKFFGLVFVVIVCILTTVFK